MTKDVTAYTRKSMNYAQKSSYFFQKTTLLDFELCYTSNKPPSGVLLMKGQLKHERTRGWRGENVDKFYTQLEEENTYGKQVGLFV